MLKIDFDEKTGIRNSTTHRTLVHLIAVVCKPLVLVAVSKRATAHLKDSKVILSLLLWLKLILP